MIADIDREKDKTTKTPTKGPYTLSKKDLFQITTLSCSTKLTHNSKNLVPVTSSVDDGSWIYLHLEAKIDTCQDFDMSKTLTYQWLCLFTNSLFGNRKLVEKKEISHW